jgi:nucleotide-binding universal stress UspA family protein
MKILVGVDATPSCQGVVQAAAARPWPAGSSFLLATAIDSFFFARAPALLAEAKKCAQQHLEHTAECLQNAGWNVTSEVILGKPRRAISLFARDWGADLFMVGSRDLSDTHRLFLGSTAQSLLRRALFGRNRTNLRPKEPERQRQGNEAPACNRWVRILGCGGSIRGWPSLAGGDPGQGHFSSRTRLASARMPLLRAAPSR